MLRRPLRDRLRRTLIALQRILDEGRSPTGRDLAVALGDVPPHSVFNALRDLRAAGVIDFETGRLDTIRILVRAEALVVAVPECRHRSDGEHSKPAASSVKRGRRRCLCCRRPFVSEGPHNHVCLPCKATDVWKAGA